MILNRNYIEQSEGAKLLVEYCENMADELNIELSKEPYWVFAAKEKTLTNDYCKLIAVATTGSAMISVTREEIEAYPTNVGDFELERKIKIKLESLL